MPTNGVWSDEDIIAEAIKYNSIADFIRSKCKAYKLAQRRFILSKVYKALEESIKWTNEKIHEEARKYKSMSGFARSNKKAYRLAKRRCLIESISRHMLLCSESPRTAKENKSYAKSVAKQYKTRKEFAKAKPTQYQLACAMGIIDSVCEHMERGVGGFDPDKPGTLYVVRLDGDMQSYIGFGITNYYEDRLYEHRRNTSKEGFTLTELEVLDFEKGGDARKIESYMKSTLPIVNTGITGFRTEAVNASDYDKVMKCLMRKITDHEFS